MKKPFSETIVGSILIGVGKIFLGSFLKRQKFNKTEKDEKRIDDILNNIPQICIGIKGLRDDFRIYNTI